ncbi:hypothetical protein JOE38_002493 [Clavibacter michiganensis]|uniref:hypothetical protein n=1 Tax=Clavibacter michiganensis TaxID=28447 RepID=UPI00195B96E1|nr:hypothetical protein [Clavibacter michiganensis]MBM7412670.1 hypothetical protein [Clavibacter michiganensis]
MSSTPSTSARRRARALLAAVALLGSALTVGAGVAPASAAVSAGARPSSDGQVDITFLDRDGVGSIFVAERHGSLRFCQTLPDPSFAPGIAISLPANEYFTVQSFRGANCAPGFGTAGSTGPVFSRPGSTWYVSVSHRPQRTR